MVLFLLVLPVLSTSKPALLRPMLPLRQEALAKRARRGGRVFPKLPLPLDEGEMWGLGDLPFSLKSPQAQSHSGAGQTKMAGKFPGIQVSKPSQWNDWGLGR